MHTQNKKTLFVFAISCMTCILVKAQTGNTGERLITQLKNGTAPGLLFAPVQNEAAPVDKITAQQKKEGLITQIRKGTAPGMKFQAGSGATGARTQAPIADGTPKTGAVKQGPLPSEDMPKALPKNAASPVAAPSQEAPAPAAAEGQQ